MKWVRGYVEMESLEIPLPDGFQPTEGQFPTYKALLELKNSADGLDYWQI